MILPVKTGTGGYNIYLERGALKKAGEYLNLSRRALIVTDSGVPQEYAETVAAQGMRNAYLLAIAPTSSTSILSGTSAGIDPVMRRFFLEEKKGSILPRVAPELSLDTWWYYKAAHLIDQSWSVRAAGVRQRHIDQAQSMNLYITNDYTMRQVLALYLDAWHSGVKTIYYIRSKSLEVEDCESCAS